MGKKKDGGIVFCMIPTWRSCFRYFVLNFSVVFSNFSDIFWQFFISGLVSSRFWKLSHFLKFQMLCSKLTISGSLVNGIWSVHGFHDISFVSRLKKMAAMKKFYFLNKVSVLFDWTQGNIFVIFTVMQDEERALMN